jgi:hypothetical protein
MSKLNKNVWRIYAVTTSALIKLPGLNNQDIGEKFIKLIDEAFKNHALFQQTQNILEFFNWASEFQLKVEFSISEWIGKAGGEAGFAFTLITTESAERGGIF